MKCIDRDGLATRKNKASGAPFAIETVQWDLLLNNGKAAETNSQIDVCPVVKLTRADGSIVCLLAEVSPERPHLAFGLVDEGVRPMLRFIDLNALSAESRGTVRAEPYCSDLTLTAAAASAEADGRIIDYAAEPCPLCVLDHEPAGATFKKVELRGG